MLWATIQYKMVLLMIYPSVILCVFIHTFRKSMLDYRGTSLLFSSINAMSFLFNIIINCIIFSFVLLQYYPLYVMRLFGHMPGMPGFILSAIFSGTLRWVLSGNLCDKCPLCWIDRFLTAYRLYIGLTNQTVVGLCRPEVLEHCVVCWIQLVSIKSITKSS